MAIQYKDAIEITVSKELKLFVRSMSASYRFISQQMQFDLIRRADMLELIEPEGVSELAVKFANLPDGQKMILTRKELYLFYSMMELVCRSFLCELGDQYKAIAMRLNKVSERKYNEVRNTELSIAQALIQNIRKDFSDDPEFDELVEKLELLDS